VAQPSPNFTAFPDIGLRFGEHSFAGFKERKLNYAEQERLPSELLRAREISPQRGKCSRQTSEQFPLAAGLFLRILPAA